MEMLEKSIQNFVRTISIYNPKESVVIKRGGIEYHPNPIKFNVDKKISFSPELELFYGHCEIICDFRIHDKYTLKSMGIHLGNGAMFELFAAENLIYAQHGFSMINEKNNPNWNSGLTVIGTINEHDALIVDTSKKDSPIIGTFGRDFFPIIDSFSGLLDCFSLLMELVYARFDGDIIEDDAPSEMFIESLRTILKKSNPNDIQVENLINYLYG